MLLHISFVGNSLSIVEIQMYTSLPLQLLIVEENVLFLVAAAEDFALPLYRVFWVLYWYRNMCRYLYKYSTVHGSWSKHIKPWGVVQSKYYSIAQGVVSPLLSRRESTYLYSSTRDFDRYFCWMLVSYCTRTVWDVFQCLHNVADKDLSAKPHY